MGWAGPKSHCPPIASPLNLMGGGSKMGSIWMLHAAPCLLLATPVACSTPVASCHSSCLLHCLLLAIPAASCTLFASCNPSCMLHPGCFLQFQLLATHSCMQHPRCFLQPQLHAAPCLLLATHSCLLHYLLLATPVACSTLVASCNPS